VWFSLFSSLPVVMCKQGLAYLQEEKAAREIDSHLLVKEQALATYMVGSLGYIQIIWRAGDVCGPEVFFSVQRLQ
jgi:hypothetical protein